MIIPTQIKCIKYNEGAAEGLQHRLGVNMVQYETHRQLLIPLRLQITMQET